MAPGTLVAHAEKKLGIKAQREHPDRRIFLKNEEECLAACTGAPHDDGRSTYSTNI